MKKLILIMLLALSSGLTVVSCTEENVEPTTTDPTGTSGNPGKP
jgi:hypothetical protein